MPNFAAIQQSATNFLLSQYATDPAVAEANVNTFLVKLLQDLGDTVVSPLTSTDDTLPILMYGLTLPVSMVLSDCYLQDATRLAADNAALIVASNALGHGFQVHL